MLSLVVAACLLGSVSAHLPEVFVSYQDGELQFTMAHEPGIRYVEVNYQLGDKVNTMLPKSAQANRGEDGDWVMMDKVILQPGDTVQYNVVTWGKAGKVHGPVTNWVYVPQAALGPRRLRGAVMFRDDFNGGSIDHSNWETEVSMYGGYNWEFQVYNPNSVFTRNGNLFLKASKTVDDPRWDENYLYHGVMDCHQIWGACTESARDGCHREGQYGILPPVMSGKVKSKPVLRYGTVEVRARIPKGDWIWPAIWMLPRNSEYGGWPRSGEIDIMESRGNRLHGVTEVSSTLHWGSSPQDNHFPQTTQIKYGGDWSAGFHTWRLEWTQDHIVTSVDNQEILRVTPGGGFAALGHTGNIWAGGERMAPFDKEFYMMFNVAVGGTSGFFPDNLDFGTHKPWRDGSTTAAQDFWQAHSQWEGSWQGDRTALEIDYIEMRYL